MTGKKDQFSNIDTTIESEFKFGNDNKVCVIGKGAIGVYTRNGERRTIDDVYCVPSLNCNLLSFGQLIEKKQSVLQE